MDKDFLKEKLEELKAADTDIVEKAIAAFSAGATISEVRTARAAKADSIEVRKIYAHRWVRRFEKLRFDTQAFKKETGKNVEIFLANMDRFRSIRRELISLPASCRSANSAFI